MNITRLTGRLLLSCSLAVSAVVCSQLSLRAETTSAISDTAIQPTVGLQTVNTGVRLGAQPIQSDSSQTLPSSTHQSVTSEATTLALATALAPATQAATDARSPQVDAALATPSTGTNTSDPAAPVVPTPGTVATSAAAFDTAAVTPSATDAQTPAQSTAPTTIAQDITPGRATRSGSSYVGVGANIGAIGRTPLGNFSGAILSKIGLTRLISVRPAVLIDGDATFLLPITLDFPIEQAGRVSFAPYVGVGASFSTGDRKNADLIVSGGVDIPLSSQFTLTAGANAGLINGVELGVLVGIGYNFAGF